MKRKSFLRGILAAMAAWRSGSLSELLRVQLSQPFSCHSFRCPCVQAKPQCDCTTHEGFGAGCLCLMPQSYQLELAAIHGNSHQPGSAFSELRSGLPLPCPSVFFSFHRYQSPHCMQSGNSAWPTPNFLFFHNSQMFP